MPVLQMAGDLVGRLVVFLLFPVVLTQAFSLRRRALTFVPAAGAPSGSIGVGESMHFLAIGDSVISGWARAGSSNPQSGTSCAFFRGACRGGSTGPRSA